MSELVYIEPTSADISMYRELIKKQGVGVCQDQLDVYTIIDKSSHFTFGFLHFAKKAQIGKNDRFYLNAFIFCSYTDVEPDEIHIELVCSRKEKKLGKDLMFAVESKATTSKLKIRKLTLDCLAEEKLKKWYESLGFIYVRTINLRQDIPKAFRMVKYL
jgi:hypothetical protein